MEEKQNIDLFENVFRNVSYSMGFLCAKANKIKNKTVGLFQNAKVTAAEAVESFNNGFESIKGEIEDETAREAKSELKGIDQGSKVEKATSDNESEKLRPEVKARVRGTKKEQRPQQERQRTKELPEGILDADFEKEIEEIDKEMAEI